MASNIQTMRTLQSARFIGNLTFSYDDTDIDHLIDTLLLLAARLYNVTGLVIEIAGKINLICDQLIYINSRVIGVMDWMDDWYQSWVYAVTTVRLYPTMGYAPG